MSTNKIPSFKRFIAGATTIIFLLLPSQAEVRSGIWAWQRGSIDSMYTHADFSALTPFCQAGNSMYPCSLKAADCYFSNDTLYAPDGVYFDSSMSATLLSRLIGGKKILMDFSVREELFYLDSMAKSIGLQAPATMEFRAQAYAMRGDGAFFVKTAENRLAFMIKTGELTSSGGAESIVYYWVYQPENSSVLYKNRLFDQPSLLKITVDAFSGRPNPTFTLVDSTALAQITHQAYVSVNTLLDSTIKRSDGATCNGSASGYRKMAIRGMFLFDDPASRLLPYIYLCGGVLEYNKVWPWSAARQIESLNDRNNALEKLIVRIGCENDLRVKDSIGTIHFCDLLPDSLKPSTAVLSPIVPEPSARILSLSQGRGRIRYQVGEVCPLRIVLFDITGDRIAVLADRTHTNGCYTIDLIDFIKSSGIYIVKMSSNGSKKWYRTVPVIWSDK